MHACCLIVLYLTSPGLVKITGILLHAITILVSLLLQGFCYNNNTVNVVHTIKCINADTKLLKVQ